MVWSYLTAKYQAALFEHYTVCYQAVMVTAILLLLLLQFAVLYSPCLPACWIFYAHWRKVLGNHGDFCINLIKTNKIKSLFHWENFNTTLCHVQTIQNLSKFSTSKARITMLPHTKTDSHQWKQKNNKILKFGKEFVYRGRGEKDQLTLLTIIEKFSWFEIVWMLEHQNMSKFTKFSFNTDSVRYSTFSLLSGQLTARMVGNLNLYFRSALQSPAANNNGREIKY